MNFKQFSKKLKPDLIFFVIGFLVFPVVLVISIYTIFGVKNDTQIAVSFPIDDMSVSIQEVNREEEQNSEDSGVDVGPMTSSISTVKTGHSEEGLKKSEQNQQEINSTGNWNATQYTQGDIIEKTYVVQLGDTLWQIANAYYGSGEQWILILNANSNIGFLPSGEQALIVPGQILSIP